MSRAFALRAYSELTEHRADRFFIADAADRFSDYRGDVQLANTRTGLRGGGQRDGVGHHQLVEYGFFNVFDCAARQYSVCGVGKDFRRAVFFQRFGGVAQSAGGIHHVVDQDAGTAFNITNDVHHFGVVGFLAALVDDRQVNTQGLGHSACTHYAADVWGNDHQIFEALVFNIVHQYWGAVDVVYRDIEEALDLIRVQVDGQNPVDAYNGEHVSHNFGADGHASGTRTAILAGIAEVGDNCSNSGR